MEILNIGDYIQYAKQFKKNLSFEEYKLLQPKYNKMWDIKSPEFF